MGGRCPRGPPARIVGRPGVQGTGESHPGGRTTESFWLALSVGFLVQGYKGFREFFATGRWNLRRFVETGGMPSSHAASVSALSTMVGLQEGFRSNLFGVTLFFSLIVMYDAAGLRRDERLFACVCCGRGVVRVAAKRSRRQTRREWAEYGRQGAAIWAGCIGAVVDVDYSDIQRLGQCDA